MLLFLHTWYCGVLESGGGREPLCSVMLLHVKEILPHRQTDNLLNSEGVEILNSVQVFYSTSCQCIYGILAVNVFKFTFLFCLMLEPIFELACIFVNCPSTIGVCIFFHQKRK